MRGGELSFPHVTALRAQRMLDVSAVRVAPATAAALIAGNHFGRVGHGAIVFVAVLVASIVLERERYPLQLMPVASFVVRMLVPVVGVGMALATFALTGKPLAVWAMAVPVLGAWVVTAFSVWVKGRFEASRRVRVGVIGSPALAQGLDEELRAAGIDSYEVVGWLAGDQPPADPADAGARRLGSLDQVRDVVGVHGIDLLVHASAAPAENEEPLHSRLEVFEGVAGTCLDLPVRLIEANQLYEDLLGHVPLGQSNSAWFQYLMHPRYRAGSPIYKRALDLVGGGLILLLAAPVLALCALVVKLTDGGPVLYRQRRVSEGGREFEMIKLRSMRVACERNGAAWSWRFDDRVTPIGKLMRRTHLDELPQLWNVLRGEMTLVGPRPERPELIAELERTVNYYDRRHICKPGIAGWAQARCGYSGSEEGTGWKLCHDLFYLKHRSLYFDLLILLENISVSLKGGVQFDVRAPQEQFILGHATGPQN